METTDEQVQQLVREALKSESISQAFVWSVKNIKCKNTTDVKNKNKTIGNIWESFCKSVLLNVLGYKKAMLLAEIPKDQLDDYGLVRKDVGIDIVAIDCEDMHIAVQCKYRSTGNISWRDIATFEGLCARSGPWDKHLIMTNSRTITREGGKNSKDFQFVFKDLNQLQRHQWNLLANYGHGNVCGTSDTNFEGVRQRWLQKLERGL